MSVGGGETRGRQMAACLDGQLDPESGYENDVCIYLHGSYRRDGPEVAHAYYDVMDAGLARISRIRGKTRGGIIAVSAAQYAELHATCPGRRVYLIPHHHCNFDRELRPKRPVRRVGCCGGDGAIQWPHDRVKFWLEMMGLEWAFMNEYTHRERVVDFYRTLDVQIVFRPTHARGIPAHTSPLKLSNAGSFGIPTVAFPEIAFVREWHDQCVYADSMNELMRQVKRLKDEPEWYEEMSVRAREKAENYHIERVAEYYRALPGA